ncbi:MAG: 50S ribosomal protein L23 [Erysipelotrichaceae bacterium]|jgi:large subunit ribosomal protein L23|nr:50S ribosomal protein L23 [Erysipelotrichaceae bacterium]MBQ1523086.1 50S ribosomal protein L23 [Erysipelotrichaceae bacterium]MBQ3384096.1 50S ribosomal protein L23 [Erysipelotrichaceae bacterium]MBR2545915.1 50S ribosomal protein L23 [Erysipelotrichaceae bacterium]MBR2701243.1 50S ribosomal protein L23 [Erysipelotrichaceae bacterium]
MAARDIIIRPIVTEKSLKNQEEDNKVTFEVAKDANKTAVKLAVEEIFNVKVEKVNIVNTPTKQKRMGRYVGTVGGIRKAVVKLADGYSINLYTEG